MALVRKLHVVENESNNSDAKKSTNDVDKDRSVVS
jgi:hypothetical protein